MAISTDHSRRIWRATTAFLIASFLDYLMTCALLGRPGNYENGLQFVESNPVAAYFLTVWGTAGLAGFKMTMVMLIAGCCRLIASESAQTARRILDFASAAGCSVVIYSASLALQYT